MVMVDGVLLKETLTVMKRLTNKSPVHVMTFARVVCFDRIILAEAFNGKTCITRVIGHCDDEEMSFSIPIAQTLALLTGGIVEIGPGRIVVDGMSVDLDNCDIDPWPVSMSGVDSPISVTREDMNRIISVMYASATDKSRWNLDTVCVHNGRVVATDGARLAIRDISAVFSDMVVVHRDNIRLMSGMFRKADMTNWSVFDNHLVVSSPSWRICCERLSGYPEYKRVLMDGNSPGLQYIVDRKQLLNALTRIKPLTTNRDKAISVLVNGDGHLTISRNGSSLSVPVETVSNGLASEWMINLSFLMDALSASRDHKVMISEYMDSRVVTVVGGDCDGLIMLLTKK